MKLSRRSFMANAVAAAAAAAGLNVPGVARAVVGQQEAIKWDKAPCRFCGTGCGVLVGTQQGRVVACQGDPDAPVNRGLNCIKGYFLPKIMYGKDCLTQPLLRMKTVNMTKKANLPQSPGSSLRCDGREIQNRPERKRAGIDRYVRFWSVDYLGRLCRVQAV